MRASQLRNIIYRLGAALGNSQYPMPFMLRYSTEPMNMNVRWELGWNHGFNHTLVPYRGTGVFFYINIEMR
ncbi:hypothetical protein HC660_36640 [Bacillus mojavensis]|uniref:Uncharacterized protein n=1 Tax=Bacillus mojavensis TaxID=72360 RepID=A0ABX6M289_BACMO|nr:hypothetical protein HC660_36640 [Bacillus mojavensis]